MSNSIRIPFCRPYVDFREAEAVSRAIAEGWITTGKATANLENRIAEYTGAKHCILLTSCTAALHLSLEWLKHSKQIPDTFWAYVPSLTFAATATEVINAGGRTFFGDVDENMCLLQREEGFDVAIPVHLCGVKAKLDYKTPVIEDSAHLIYPNQCKGSKNLICYSFYATKNLTMGEGGAICTNDEEAAKWLKQARHHGISKDGWKRYENLEKWEYDIEFIGWKYNPSDVLSSILNVQFDKVDMIHWERKRCVDRYNKQLGLKNEGLHLYTVLAKDRKEFMKKMAENGIQCSVHFKPIHQMTAFKELGYKPILPRTEYLGERLVSLPLFPSLTNDEIDFICQTIKQNDLLTQ